MPWLLRRPVTVLLISKRTILMKTRRQNLAKSRKPHLKNHKRIGDMDDRVRDECTDRHHFQPALGIPPYLPLTNPCCPLPPHTLKLSQLRLRAVATSLCAEIKLRCYLGNLASCYFPIWVDANAFIYACKPGTLRGSYATAASQAFRRHALLCACHHPPTIWAAGRLG